MPVREDCSLGQIPPQVGECPYFRGTQSLLGSEGQGTCACVYCVGDREGIGLDWGMGWIGDRGTVKA